MSSDEDDYMSEAFLSKCVPGKEDVKPGLIKGHSAKRQHELLKRREEQKRPRRNAEEELREIGLQQPIGSDNKGFSLMQKMGYKPGEGIGKTSGRVEPVEITLKKDRFGLGRETVMREISELRARKMIERHKSQQACTVEDYRRRIAEKNQEKFISKDLYKSQSTCQRLDQQKDIDSPDQAWFWPETKDDDGSDDEPDDQNEFEPFEKLKLLTSYLRECHLYCLWCGTQFEDDADMKDNCPGPTRDDH